MLQGSGVRHHHLVSIATAHTRLRAVTAATRTPGAGCHCPPTYRQQPLQSTAMKCLTCLSRERYQELSGPHSLPPAGFVGARQRADGRRRRTPRAVVSAQSIQARVTPASLRTATRTRYGRTKSGSYQHCSPRSCTTTKALGSVNPKGAPRKAPIRGASEPHRTLGPTCQTDSPAGVVNR